MKLTELSGFISFLQLCCVLRADATSEVVDLITNYENWCQRNGKTPCSRTRCRDILLNEAGCSLVNAGYWKGVGIIPDPETAARQAASQYLERRCHYTPDTWTLKTELYDDYMNWLSVSVQEIPVLTRQQFSTVVSTTGRVKSSAIWNPETKNSSRAWAGIAIRRGGLQLNK